ncbi:hypothetical protein GSU68_03050 [Rathayibacter sp. VKM Ac-2759]|uniref:hypothetical protein n=1 Tax=Rathayibacter sp. VKM Ac-2759 TaxID=2609252 RepID=UPI001316E075|nr:hypothetical protein [Rathayibacter sp. VKM Ac-2759]QHC65657.1 hypothetical protein GSU68_03050 [Rathayibacter sp. VKM Ac-2759]
MSDDFLAKVGSWLEKSGYAFELRIARAIRSEGANDVNLSFSYTDATTGALREGDVLAKFDWTAIEGVPASIEVVIECKSGRDHPWVLFSDEDVTMGSTIEDWAYFSHGSFVGITEPLTKDWSDQPPFHDRRVASHVVAMGAKDSHNPASDAVRQVLSAAEGRKTRYTERHFQDRRGCVIIPVIVIGGRLVEARLSSIGDIELTEVASAVVAGPRRGDKPAHVFVVTETEVTEFAQSFRDLADRANKQR